LLLTLRRKEKSLQSFLLFHRRREGDPKDQKTVLKEMKLGAKKLKDQGNAQPKYG
jgi:hypothetical protein